MSTWDENTDIWGLASAVHAEAKPVQIIGNEFYQADSGPDFQGTPISVVLSRTALTIYGRDQQGRPRVDPGVIKNIQGIWPEFKAPEGTVIRVQVGFHDTPEGPVNWSPARDFTVGSSLFLDMYATGPYIAVRFESEGQLPWDLTGYALEIEPVGGR